MVLSGGLKKSKKVAVLICLLKVFIVNFNCSSSKKGRAKLMLIIKLSHPHQVKALSQTLTKGGAYKFLSELASAFSARRPFFYKKKSVKKR